MRKESEAWHSIGLQLAEEQEQASLRLIKTDAAVSAFGYRALTAAPAPFVGSY